MVGDDNSKLKGYVLPNFSSSTANIFAAKSECPPRAKKLSSIPTWSSDNTSDQIWASCFSTGPRGGANAVSSSGLIIGGTGNALRSTLPLGTTGIASKKTNADGTM